MLHVNSQKVPIPLECLRHSEVSQGCLKAANPSALAGRDLLACGVAPGPELGARLAELEQAWIASDFRLDRAALLARASRKED